MVDGKLQVNIPKIKIDMPFGVSIFPTPDDEDKINRNREFIEKKT